MADKELHARLVVHDIENMSGKDLQRLIDWLYKLVHDFRTTPQKAFSKKFTARLWK